jgi:hypothetical protein
MVHHPDMEIHTPTVSQVAKKELANNSTSEGDTGDLGGEVSSKVRGCAWKDDLHC